MNILIDANPTTVIIGNKEYRINTDFRISILFEQLIQDRNLSEREKMAAAINLYFPVVPGGINTLDGLNETMSKILWFYRCGDESVIKETSENVKPLFCYDSDADYIYSAFLSQYNIDLQDDILHWWKFRALFKGLTKDNKLNEIIGYRAIKIDDNMSDSEKNFYREMKELYKIPDKRTIEEIEEDFNSSMSSMF